MNRYMTKKLLETMEIKSAKQQAMNRHPSGYYSVSAKLLHS